MFYFEDDCDVQFFEREWHHLIPLMHGNDDTDFAFSVIGKKHSIGGIVRRVIGFNLNSFPSFPQKRRPPTPFPPRLKPTLLPSA
jgi:hypothetical protein